MRTLCLSLARPAKSSWAETFLAFSPRVHYRDPGLVFIDVSSTSHLFGGEAGLMREVRTLAEELFPNLTASLADSPSAAQVFTQVKPFQIIAPDSEGAELNSLPVEHLRHLEGLIAWRSPTEISSVIDFFQTLGMRKLEDVRRIELSLLRERWGETGTLIWRRLHGRDQQVISPLESHEPLTEYTHFDFAVALLPFLLHSIEQMLKRLTARLQGRGEFARKALLHLHCEYDDQYHLIELNPATPTRNLELLMKLAENQLSRIELDNPIRQLTTEVIAVPEKVQQLDFWQPRESDQNKWQSLVSLFSQAQITTGFLRPQAAIMPEDSWSITPEFDTEEVEDDAVLVEGNSIQIKHSYSRTLRDAPRPSFLLADPEPLDDREMRRLKMLNPAPIERLEDGWWENDRGRDYHMAVSPQGQLLWIFYDRVENRYYLQGHFD